MSPVPTGSLPKTVAWEDGELYLLNQTLLPGEAVVERQETRDEQAVHDVLLCGARRPRAARLYLANRLSADCYYTPRLLAGGVMPFSRRYTTSCPYMSCVCCIEK